MMSKLAILGAIIVLAAFVYWLNQYVSLTEIVGIFIGMMAIGRKI